MKTIYEVLYPFGAKAVEVEESFEVQFPFTDIKPDENRDLMLQFFDIKLDVWRPVEYLAGAEKLNLLENFYTKATNDVDVLTEDNTNLKVALTQQEEQLTDTQLALAEVYELLVPTNKKEEGQNG